MVDSTEIREHAEVISADGIHVGTVDRVEGDRIKLIKKDSGPGHEGHHHFIPLVAVESIDGNRVRLNTSSRDVMGEEEEADRSPIH
ncbi:MULTISPECIES: DUF2171 domain-containing protein [unclassified Rhizobium]|uniref:DUF2171 domain-containing protein n=1 Tax=unclassified Rhizobium TaxID=2613769 RepID=UPI000701B8C3|nr:MULTISPECIES: DUF2171 domain-containing protein [unclassified Rhizobium]KQV35150.1 hypothetical protein ASC86_13135 [Rhizobium sp. Root1212]KRD24955.1 hypothetical protein ASE37_13130 [Rhizobium sp. Root268]